MPAIVKRLCDQGLFDVPYRASNLDEAARYEARSGVYTVANTFARTKTLLLDAHLARLEDSAARANIALSYERDRLKAALRRMILASSFGDVRFRISVPAAAPCEMILSIEPYQPPSPALIENGVACGTTAATRRTDPAAKTSDWMHERRALVSARPAGIYETFLLNGAGGILEGLSSNFYAVIDGELFTAVHGVLAGISRQIVFEVCDDIVPLRLEAPQLADIGQFSEALLTSSSRGIIPVVSIDGIIYRRRERSALQPWRCGLPMRLGSSSIWKSCDAVPKQSLEGRESRQFGARTGD